MKLSTVQVFYDQSDTLHAYCFVNVSNFIEAHRLISNSIKSV